MVWQARLYRCDPVRAYAHTGAIALEAAGTALMRVWRAGNLVMPYSLYQTVSRWLWENGAALVTPDFAAEVTVSFLLPQENWEALCAFLQNAAAGTIAPRDMGLEMGKG